MSDDPAVAAMLNAAGTVAAPAPAPVPVPAPAVAPTPARALVPSKTVENVKRVGQRIVGSWAFKYVVMFVVLIALFYLMKPSFVLQRPLPSPANPTAEERCSHSRVFVSAAVAVGVALLLPLAYHHREAISTGFKSIVKQIRE